MKATDRGGGGIATKKKSTARGFICGCADSKAVSVSDGSDKSPVASTPATTPAPARRRPPAPSSSADTLTMASSSSTFCNDTDDASAASTPSVAALLRQLGELEHGVRALDGIAKKDGGGGRGRRERHRRSASDGGGGGGGTGRVAQSVAVVKETADPLGDFRRSMLQMIVEKEIVGGGELRELLRRFLSLNSPRHHHLVLGAFAEIWDEVFAGYEPTPDLLLPSNAEVLRPPLDYSA